MPGGGVNDNERHVWVLAEPQLDIERQLKGERRNGARGEEVT